MRQPDLPPILSLLLPILLLTSPALGVDDKKELQPCTIYNAANGNFYDLNTITVRPLEDHKKTHKDDRTEGWHARGYDYGTNFTMNFCAPVIEDLKEVEGIKSDLVKNVSAFYKIGDKTFSIGQTSTEPFFRGRKLTLNYTNGSPCDTTTTHLYQREPSKSNHSPHAVSNDKNDDSDGKSDKTKPYPTSSASNPNPRRKSTLISFLCDRDSLAPKAHVSFIGASPDECTYFFEARSMAACGGVIAASQSLSPGGVFGVIGLIAIAVYLFGGIAYQRTVMHQRGWRQLPNYALWAGIWGFVTDIFVILTSSCTRFLPRRKGYNQLSSNGRGRGRDDEANGLIDSYEEEY